MYIYIYIHLCSNFPFQKNEGIPISTCDSFFVGGMFCHIYVNEFFKLLSWHGKGVFVVVLVIVVFVVITEKPEGQKQPSVK